ncbi:DUF5602 domain-containing protein [Tolypothrix sp. FACHB-123]|uniref:DUF5602 domain-containing protein n=1 Tax=Tolypothrix sp. FACHB-123 TaxID=2692868 RepID=UPI001689C1CE|nr:DUF5602 domain-containing protein [Tolypothrix sp. FACHB-123]MBD2357590.1 DUF5602 domain-containing protein [Tolypothrix sp. FACHB-123]
MKKIKYFINVLAVLLLVVSSCLWYPQTAIADTKTIVGEQKSIGNGSVRTWIKVDEKTGIPDSIGVTLTEAALEGLPQEKDPAQKGSIKLKLIDGSPYHTYEYELMFPPKEVDRTAFTHMGFNWNPEGHGPLPNVFFRPHFDVHFYMATPDYRHQVKNEDLLDLKILNIEPPKEFIPVSYERAPNTSEPRMGTHYADMKSEQLQPGKFTNIFLFGGHDGNILFWEPMITRDYLTTKPNFHAEIPQPAAYPVSGYYPTAYTVVYDQERKEFDISLDNLTLRTASYPGNVYGVQSCLDSRMVNIIFKYREEKPEHVQIPKECQDLVPIIQQALK